MAVIKVPRTPKRAFNKQRRVSDLLRRQIEHLEWASRPASKRKPDMLKPVRVRTEGQAAERIAQLTAAVREQASRDAATRAVPPHDFTAVPVTVPTVAAVAAGVTTPSSRRRRSPASSRVAAATRRKKRSVSRRPSSRKRAAADRQRKRKK